MGAKSLATYKECFDEPVEALMRRGQSGPGPEADGGIVDPLTAVEKLDRGVLHPGFCDPDRLVGKDVGKGQALVSKLPVKNEGHRS